MAIGTHNKRYKTLKEHRAAVAARKTLQGGKNRGPVANADAYGSTIKKPKAKAKKVASAPKPKASAPKKAATAPKAAAPKKTSRPNQTVNGASLGSKLTPAERKKRQSEMTSVGKPTKQSPRAGSRASSGTKSTPKKTTKPTRSRTANRRSTSTKSSRAATARKRGLSRNVSEMKAAARKRAHKSGVFKSSYNRR